MPGSPQHCFNPELILQTHHVRRHDRYGLCVGGCTRLHQQHVLFCTRQAGRQVLHPQMTCKPKKCPEMLKNCLCNTLQFLHTLITVHPHGDDSAGSATTTVQSQRMLQASRVQRRRLLGCLHLYCFSRCHRLRASPRWGWHAQHPAGHGQGIISGALHKPRVGSTAPWWCSSTHALRPARSFIRCKRSRCARGVSPRCTPAAPRHRQLSRSARPFCPRSARRGCARLPAAASSI